VIEYRWKDKRTDVLLDKSVSLEQVWRGASEEEEVNQDHTASQCSGEGTKERKKIRTGIVSSRVAIKGSCSDDEDSRVDGDGEPKEGEDDVCTIEAKGEARGQARSASRRRYQKDRKKDEEAYR
jgi:hypothetical protein